MPSGASARLLATIRRRLATYLASVERRLADPAQLPDGYGQFSSDHLIQTTWPLALHAWLLSECAARGLDAEGAKLIAPQNPLPVGAQETKETSVFVILPTAMVESGRLDVKFRVTSPGYETIEKYRLLGPSAADLRK